MRIHTDSLLTIERFARDLYITDNKRARLRNRMVWNSITQLLRHRLASRFWALPTPTRIDKAIRTLHSAIGEWKALPVDERYAADTERPQITVFGITLVWVDSHDTAGLACGNHITLMNELCDEHAKLTALNRDYIALSAWWLPSRSLGMPYDCCSWCTAPTPAASHM